MNSFVLAPPLDFLLLLGIIGLFSWLVKGLAPPPGVHSDGKGEPYACGQDVKTGRIQPSYTEFFPFAFFFTIMHVTTLLLCIVPSDSVWLAIPFLSVMILAILILFRRD